MLFNFNYIHLFKIKYLKLSNCYYYQIVIIYNYHTNFYLFYLFLSTVKVPQPINLTFCKWFLKNFFSGDNYSLIG